MGKSRYWKRFNYILLIWSIYICLCLWYQTWTVLKNEDYLLFIFCHNAWSSKVHNVFLIELKLNFFLPKHRGTKFYYFSIHTYLWHSRGFRLIFIKSLKTFYKNYQSLNNIFLYLIFLIFLLMQSQLVFQKSTLFIMYLSYVNIISIIKSNY